MNGKPNLASILSEFFDDFVALGRIPSEETVHWLLAELAARDWPPGLTRQTYAQLTATGLRRKNLPLAAVAVELLASEHPVTLRGLFYRVVSAGWLPSTDKRHYDRLGRIMKRLREKGVVPFSWIVDNMRSSLKPSSWTGLQDYVDTVRDAYRKDFWANLPKYVHVFCEKDAIAGVLAPVTQEFDVALSPIRGYASLTYAHEIAEMWSGIRKPIFAYYLGDFDPSGFDLERDLKEKLNRYGGRSFEWTRLGVNADDFEDFGLLPLAPKKSDRRYQTFIEEHGYQCAELDALPATELRQRVRNAITQHIPQDEWSKLQDVERIEKESFETALRGMNIKNVS